MYLEISSGTWPTNLLVEHKVTGSAVLLTTTTAQQSVTFLGEVKRFPHIRRPVSLVNMETGDPHGEGKRFKLES